MDDQLSSLWYGIRTVLYFWKDRREWLQCVTLLSAYYSLSLLLRGDFAACERRLLTPEGRQLLSAVLLFFALFSFFVAGDTGCTFLSSDKRSTDIASNVIKSRRGASPRTAPFFFMLFSFFFARNNGCTFLSSDKKVPKKQTGDSVPAPLRLPKTGCLTTARFWFGGAGGG